MAAENVQVDMLLDRDLAHIQTDANAQRVHVRMRAVQPVDPRLDLERALDCSRRLGKHSHEGIADALDDNAGIAPRDDPIQKLVVPAPDFVRVAFSLHIGERGEAFDIREHDRQYRCVLQLPERLNARDFFFGKRQRRARCVHARMIAPKLLPGHSRQADQRL